MDCATLERDLVFLYESKDWLPETQETSSRLVKVFQNCESIMVLVTDGDAAFIAKALGDIARAKGMSQVARDAGVSRESLYKALSGERVPSFDTVLKVTKALGLRLHAEVADLT